MYCTVSVTCQVMADMKKNYDNLIIINLCQFCQIAKCQLVETVNLIIQELRFWKIAQIFLVSFSRERQSERIERKIWNTKFDPQTCHYPFCVICVITQLIAKNTLNFTSMFRSVRLWNFKDGPRTLRPESSENIPILLQEADLCFSKQNCPRNPKMGSKQSVVVATQ